MKPKDKLYTPGKATDPLHSQPRGPFCSLQSRARITWDLDRIEGGAGPH
jgi:hypothetical protein